MVDRAFSLPSRYKVRRGSGKYLLKLAARGKIPDEIIDRPKKGFGIPLATLAARPPQGPHRRRRRALAGLRSRHPRPRRVRGLERRPPGQAAPTTASLCGRCSCWITGSAGTRIPDRRSTHGALTQSKDSTGLAGSFRLRVVTYSAILPESQRPAGTLARTDDARELRRQARDGRRLRDGPQPVLVRRGRRRHRCWASTWTTAAWRPRARTWRRSPTRGSRRPRPTTWIRRSTAPSIASPASACCTTWPTPRARSQRMWSCVAPGGDLVLWCYAKEGNRLMLPVIQSFRALGSRLPINATHAVAKGDHGAGVAGDPDAPVPHRLLPAPADAVVQERRVDHLRPDAAAHRPLLDARRHGAPDRHARRAARPHIEFVQGNSWHVRVRRRR